MTRGKWEPSPAVRDELEKLILSDQSRLGQVYRLTRQGLDAKEIARTLGVSTSNFVWNYSRIVDALLDGKLSYAPAFASSSATRFRSLARDPALSGESIAYLDECVAELERRSERSRRHNETFKMRGISTTVMCRSPRSRLSWHRMPYAIKFFAAFRTSNANLNPHEQIWMR